jgi:uncharacterized protein YndB with AHSA1/START domain
MPREKDLKRLVRARMQKTGEAYTTARSHVLRKPRRNTPSAVAPERLTTKPAGPDTKDFATIAGMNDAAVREKTGRGWEEWVRTLDAHDAATLAHREIARIVSTTYEVPSWWAQTVTVGYERIKGLRVRGQRRNGTFGMTISRTFNVPVATLFDAWADAATRRRWLGATGVRIRTATPPKSIRLGWPDGTIIAVGFTAKGPAKSSVALEHGKLPSREAAAEVKRTWAAWLTALANVLA